VVPLPRPRFLIVSGSVVVQVSRRPCENPIGFAFRRGRSDGRVHRPGGFRGRAAGSAAAGGAAASAAGGRSVRPAAGPVRQVPAERVLLRPDDVRPTGTVRRQLHGNGAEHASEHGSVPEPA